MRGHPIDVKIRYTKSSDTTGWLRVKLEPSGESGYLCEFVKVAISEEGARTHFLILEGTNKGLKASEYLTEAHPMDGLSRTSNHASPWSRHTQAR